MVRIYIYMALLFLALGMVVYVTITSDLARRKATTLTHSEQVRMCNARGMLFADGVCQRIYINLCRRL